MVLSPSWLIDCTGAPSSRPARASPSAVPILNSAPLSPGPWTESLVPGDPTVPRPCCPSSGQQLPPLRPGPRPGTMLGSASPSPLFRLMALGGGAYPPHTFSPHMLRHFSVTTVDTHLPPQISLSGCRAVGYCAGGGVGYMGCERSRRCLRKSRR